MVYSISEIIAEVGGRSKLVDLVVDGIIPYMKDLSEEDIESMPWLGIEDIFSARKLNYLQSVLSFHIIAGRK